nr:MAG TPA: hypothetical protein [Caudoviricetes sp.]
MQNLTKFYKKTRLFNRLNENYKYSKIKIKHLLKIKR